METALPAGMSSLCVWEDHIFLTGLTDQKLTTLCVRRRDGKVLWRQFAPADQFEEVNPDSSPASATPATDGERIYSYFGSYGLLANWSDVSTFIVFTNGEFRAALPVVGAQQFFRWCFR